MRNLILLLLVCLCAAAFAGDWPQFLGPTRNGVSPETRINLDWKAKPPKLLWKTPMSDKGFAGPSVAGGKVFIIDHQDDQDIVRALDLASGREIWRFSYTDASGDNYGFSRSTPTVNAGKVYTVSREGQVYCLDAARGARVWMRNLLTEFHGNKPSWDYAMSVLIDGNKAIVCPGGPHIAVALDKDTGKTLWEGGGSDNPSYATPVVATLNGVKQYLFFTISGLVSVDAATGKRRWLFPWKTGCDVNAATPIVSGASIFITSGYGHGCALVEVQNNTPHARWQNDAIQAHFSSPVIVNGYIYGSSDPGKLVCLDMKTGHVCWQHPGFEKGGLMSIAGSLLAFNGGNGVLVAVKIDPTKYHEIARWKPLGGQSWTAPIYADGKLIIRNKTTLACYAM